MSRSMISRSIAITLAVVVVVAFSFVTGEKAHAAAKKKTVWLVTSEKNTYTNDGKSDTYTTKYTYDKRGLIKQTLSIDPEGSKTKAVLKRTKKGAVKSVKYYSGKQLVRLSKGTVNKKGDVTKSKLYTVNNGKKKLMITFTYTYYGNGNLKKEVQESKTAPVFTFTYYYRKNGTLKKAVEKSKQNETCSSVTVTTYDKKERATKKESSYVFDYSTATETSTFTYKQNKHGDVTKSVETTKRTDKSKEDEAQETTTESTTTTTFKYKYDKHGNIKKKTSRIVYQEGDQKTVSTSKLVKKYKKMKVDKKYLKYIAD